MMKDDDGDHRAIIRVSLKKNSHSHSNSFSRWDDGLHKTTYLCLTESICLQLLYFLLTCSKRFSIIKKYGRNTQNLTEA